MKRKLFKDSIKEIINTRKRFISIILIVLLGVGFYAGIKESSPEMKRLIDSYFDDLNVMDLQIVSTMGLTQDDVKELEKIEGVKEIQVGYYIDATTVSEENEKVLRIESLTKDINKVELIEGRLPQEDNECVVENAFLIQNDYQIGDILEVKPEEVKDEEGNAIEFLKNKNMKIVGTIKSPLYISRTRPSTKLGAGEINNYIYVLQSNISEDLGYYTELYIVVENAKEKQCYSDEYDSIIENVKLKIDNIIDQREKSRYEEVVGKLNKKIDDSTQELNEKITDARNQIQEGQNKIDDGRKQLENGKKQLEEAKRITNSQIKSAKNQINDAKIQVEQKEQELNEQEKIANSEIEETKKQIRGIESIKNQYSQILFGIQQINNIEYVPESITNGLLQMKNAIDTQLESLNINTDSITQFINIVNENKDEEFEKAKSDLNQITYQIQGSIENINNQITTGENELENGKKKIQQVKFEILQQQEKLNKEETNARAKFKKEENKIKTSEKEIKENQEKLDEEAKKINDEEIKALKEINDAKDKINDIKEPQWYVLTRKENAGYISYVQDADRIANIGKIFPIVFFVVATLICLNAMTRMVEEERVQIGTLKALGYNKKDIMKKYIIYAALATIIGGIVGSVIGFLLLPGIIIRLYSMMYQVPKYVPNFEMYYAVTGILVALVCTVGATYFTANKVLKITPAELMRPKAPQPGKKVLLEHIPFIWNRLKFSQKVTIRNLFRYKKRFLMTIIGIAGCSALIVSGFGIRDSVTDMIPLQYGGVYKYDIETALNSGIDRERIKEDLEEINNKEEIAESILLNIQSVNLIKNDKEENIQLVVPEEKEKFTDFVSLNNSKGRLEKYQLDDNEVIITEKLANLYDIEVGDIIKISDNDNKEYDVKVGAITEQYLRHFMYMSKDLYQKVFDENAKPNRIWSILEYEDEEKVNQLVKDLLKNNDDYVSISLVSNTQNIFSEVMDNMGIVAWVLVIAAALLAFVVLYNLSNLNISERLRELATIKVLGFYDKEVYKYVTRENVILTFIGIAIGLVAGKFLTIIIMKTAELDIVMFSYEIHYLSYIISIVLTTIFTLIVNFITYFSLKKIDMIESLKSVE